MRVEPEPDWGGPDPLREMVERGARVICRKPAGHDRAAAAEVDRLRQREAALAAAIDALPERWPHIGHLRSAGTDRGAIANNEQVDREFEALGDWADEVLGRAPRGVLAATDPVPSPAAREPLDVTEWAVWYAVAQSQIDRGEWTRLPCADEADARRLYGKVDTPYTKERRLIRSEHVVVARARLSDNP